MLGSPTTKDNLTAVVSASLNSPWPTLRHTCHTHSTTTTTDNNNNQASPSRSPFNVSLGNQALFPNLARGSSHLCWASSVGFGAFDLHWIGLDKSRPGESVIIQMQYRPSFLSAQLAAASRLTPRLMSTLEPAATCSLGRSLCRRRRRCFSHTFSSPL